VYENPEEAEEHTRWWTDEVCAALQKGVPGAYVNFLMADDSRARIREAYPDDGSWARLRAIKRSYDPTNLFRTNNNIPPAEAS
jgi:FAD/FMN-containing dehydrogenase